jgi:serine/threonine protein kinase/tetratricopeptide (TPR) repeat protein
MTPKFPVEVAGRYRIERELGQGGMGIVYAAHDLQLDRPVALKRIRGAAEDTTARERLKREARTAAGIRHPNVCQVHEIAEDVDDLFIVMELVDGQSLAERIRQGALPLTDAVQLALSMLSVLEEMHRRGLIHRDLKPANIFLTPHGVKLLDFGLARTIDLSASETSTFLTTPGMVIGSPGYMSPEQALGQSVDQRTDLHAVAATLYEMLAGVSPFARESVVDTLHAVVHEHPPSLGGSAAIGATDAVIRRGLAKRPEDRFQTAHDMAQALRVALAQSDSGESPRARPMTRLIVLPFRLLKADPEIEFLSFSLADAISTTLSGLQSLIVRSSLTAAGVGNHPLDPKALAMETAVDAVVTGSLLRSGEQVRVTAQLIATPDGTILWSHTSQMWMADVFQLQDDLCRRILESLAVPLSVREYGVLKQDVPSSPQAYELYLRANHHSHDAQNWPLARDLYESCLGKDPTYAPAWARLGRCYRLMAKFSATTVEEQKDSLRRADEAFQRALSISPELPVAHNLYTALECDLGRAIEAVGRLLAMAQKRTADAELFAGLVHACRYAGLLDASMAAHQRARQLDPRVPTSVAHTYWMKGKFDSAIEDPFGTVGYISALALASAGREQEAREFLRERETRVADARARDYLLALRALLEGDREASIQALNRVTLNPDPESLFYVARTFARLGEAERAIEELERVAAAFFCYPVFVRDPWLDPLRGDVRFLKLLRALEEKHRRAAATFIEHGGERVLGCAAS